ncbi:hypothetical protein HC02_00380 [Vibrio parahaemolyticus]|nr:hypothetical protein HC02_00380 [Vibrio parahaemolyticus]
MKANGRIKNLSKKEAEHAKRQAHARRQLEIMQELRALGSILFSTPNLSRNNAALFLRVLRYFYLENCYVFDSKT